VSDFVEQCRREWKRLRVPDAVADEMAADLAADLKEAEADGASAEEVLGSGATDPRSFAASWAAERAVIPRPRLTARLPGGSLVRAAIAALLVITAIGAALVIFASPHASAPTAAASRVIPLPQTPTRTPLWISVSQVWVERGRDVVLVPARGWRVASPALRLPLPPSPSMGALWRAPRSGVEIHRVGAILLTVGILGMIPWMLFLFWSSRARPDHSGR